MSSKISWQQEFVHRHSICQDHSNPDVKNNWVWTNSLLLCPNREVYPTLPGPKLSVVIRDRNCPPTLKRQKRIITLFINLDILLQGTSLDKILSYVTTIWVKMLLSISAEKTHPSNLISNNIDSYENEIDIECLVITTECIQPNWIILSELQINDYHTSSLVIFSETNDAK